jgi:hypothetical protein
MSASRFIVLAAALLLAACATHPPAPQPAPTAHAAHTPATSAASATPLVLPVEAEPSAPATQLLPPSPGPVGAALAYADHVRGLAPNDLAAEINRLGDGGASPATQMQLALALAQTRNPPDLVRAQALAQRVAANTSPDGLALQPLARLLAARFTEQRRVEDDRDRQAQQARDAQRRLDQLNDRIEALRAIERSFSRPHPPAAPGGGSGAPAGPSGAPR